MGHAFQTHNELGRLFSEQVYVNELKRRLQLDFESVETEVPIMVQFETFTKTYFADLVVDASVIYELKAVGQLSPRHRLQLLQYLLLANLKHGKLINFGADKVDGQFVSTNLTTEQRQHLVFHTEKTRASDAANRFVAIATKLVSSLGGFLSTELVCDAITHFFGGENVVVQNIIVYSGETITVHQPVRLLSPNTAFKVTAITGPVERYRNQLSRFLLHTELDSIEWMNMSHHDINFESIIR